MCEFRCVFAGTPSPVSLLLGQGAGNCSLAGLGWDVRVLLVQRICCFFVSGELGKKNSPGLKAF